MSEYTKVPWKVENDLIYSLEHCEWKNGVEQFRNRFSARVSNYNSAATAEEITVNANLMGATPELLEALKEIISVTDRKHDYWDRAHASIAKAEGHP